jgi:integrase
MRHVRENPFDGVDGTKGGPGARVRIRRALTQGELAEVVAAARGEGGCGPMRAVAYQVTAYSGFRRGELKRMRKEDCTPLGPRPRWHVRPEVTKNGLAANLPMTPECANALREL